MATTRPTDETFARNSTSVLGLGVVGSANSSSRAAANDDGAAGGGAPPLYVLVSAFNPSVYNASAAAAAGVGPKVGGDLEMACRVRIASLRNDESLLTRRAQCGI